MLEHTWLPRHDSTLSLFLRPWWCFHISCVASATHPPMFFHCKQPAALAWSHILVCAFVHLTFHIVLHVQVFSCMCVNATDPMKGTRKETHGCTATCFPCFRDSVYQIANGIAGYGYSSRVTRSCTDWTAWKITLITELHKLHAICIYTPCCDSHVRPRIIVSRSTNLCVMVQCHINDQHRHSFCYDRSVANTLHFWKTKVLLAN